jgi:hypothetical protein
MSSFSSGRDDEIVPPLHRDPHIAVDRLQEYKVASLLEMSLAELPPRLETTSLTSS